MFARIIHSSKKGDKFLIFSSNSSTSIIPSADGLSVGDFISCEIRFQDDDLENHDSYDVIAYRKISAEEVTPVFKRNMLLDEDVISGAKFDFD